MLGTDSVSIETPSASFGDKNVGTAKPVTVAGLALSGPDAGNYKVAPPTGLAADITPAPLTIAANNLSKAEGTELVFTGKEFSATGLVNGEQVASVTLTSTGAPASAQSGAYPILLGNAVGANGFASGNYTISYLNGALAVFAPAALSAQQQVLNQVTTFATLFVEEAKTQSSIGPAGSEDKKNKDDIVITDKACQP
jgi:hypothetical protein